MRVAQRFRLIAALAALALFLGACAGNQSADEDPLVEDSAATQDSDQPTEPEDHDADAAHSTPDGDLSAADLRITLNNLLQEHVFFAGAAVNEALQGRDAAFEAAAGTLDRNSVELAGAIGLVYGPEAEDAFLGLWRAHIGMFVDYTTGLATGDQAQADQAVADLQGYAGDFAAFLSGANPNLPAETVESLVLDHVLTTKAAVDALHSGDAEAGFAELRTAMGHMHGIADPLAGAIAQQFPDEFDGDPATPAVDLRRDLNLILQEHTYLAGAAVNEALKGNTAGFEGAAGALEGNTQQFVDAISSIYGPEAGEAFGGLWRSHIGMFVDYTQATAAGDEAGQQQAVDDLTGYAADFAVFLSDATGIDQAAAEQLVIEHVLTLKDAVDTIAAGDGNPFDELKEAGDHMQGIADPLADQIARQQQR